MLFDESLNSEMQSSQLDVHNFLDPRVLIKIVLILSHGQATVECEFSVNKEVMVENLVEQFLIAQHIINDHFHSVGGVLNISYSKGLLLSAAGARQKHQTYLEDQRRAKEAQKKNHQKRAFSNSINPRADHPTTLLSIRLIRNIQTTASRAGYHSTTHRSRS
ncbi:UNVERIFIED_CONTAM: hypothetical protein FKN15_044017 [Acipenser sinensis]